MMTPTVLAAGPESAVLVSVYKPIIVYLVVGAWAYTISWFDKDLKQFFLPRQVWNGIQMASGILGLLIWLFLPIFWIGMPLALIFFIGGPVAYVFYRNSVVQEEYKWKFSVENLTKRFSNVQQDVVTAASSFRFLAPNNDVLPVPLPEDPRIGPHTVLERLFDFALPRKANVAEINLDPQQTTIAVIIDGVKFAQPNLDAKAGMAVIDYLKANANLDVNDRRKKQSGKLKIDADGSGRHNIVVTTAGSTRGVTLTLNIDPGHNVGIKYSKLGLVDAQKALLDSALEKVGGTILIVSPPDSGQTTTLYSLTAKHDPYTVSIHTIEEDVLLELEGVTQNRVDFTNDPPAVTDRLRQLMLRETNVVMIARIPEAPTAKMMSEYSHQTRFYAGVRNDDAVSAIKAWIKAVGEPEDAVKALSAIVSQRLVRKLCETCRIGFKPDPEALRKLNLPAGKVNELFKHSGQVVIGGKPQVCPDCFGIGYRGRCAVFEILSIDDEARGLIIAGQFEQFRAQQRKLKTLWLQEAALTKVVEGLTSVAEITRALAKEQPAKAAGGSDETNPKTAKTSAKG